MKLNWPAMGVGYMNDPTVMSGFLKFIIIHGGLIIMEDGSGILLSAGPGFLMIRGDGVFTIMGDGTGELGWVGTGFPPEPGGLPGSTGTGDMDMIISDGAL